jgi:hypothetical protein
MKLGTFYRLSALQASNKAMKLSKKQKHLITKQDILSLRAYGVADSTVGFG